MGPSGWFTLLVLSAVPACGAEGWPPRDGSGLGLRGDGMAEDSVALALTAAARQLGCGEVGLARAWYLTGNAFAPVVDRGEDCASWWHVEACLGDRGLASAAAAMGLSAARVGRGGRQAGAANGYGSGGRPKAAAGAAGAAGVLGRG